MMKTQWHKLDQRTRFGCSSVTAISGGKLSLWFRLTHISQSLAIVRHVWGGTSLVCCFAPFRLKDVRYGKVVWKLSGMALVDSLLCSSVEAKHLSTWLWHQMYLHWIRLFLQHTMCLSVARVTHW